MYQTLFASVIMISFFSSNAFSQLKSEDTEFSIATVIQWVNSEKAKSIEDVLSLLPDEYLKNYTLVKSSGSLQRSSFEYPRAVMFGETARVILTFNGNPEHMGFGTLEMMEIPDDGLEIEMRRIDFNQSPPLVSERNPNTCKNCHGKFERPLFGSYHDWPNFYGELQDRLDATIGEEIGFSRYLENVKTHKLYSKLWRDPKNPNFPYQDCRIDSEEEGPCWTHQYRPNDRFGHLVGFRTAHLMGRRVLRSAEYQRFPYSFLYSLLPCENGNDKEFVSR
ncbi:MAG: hypothetical protein KDD25_02880, partial [Bdellovibrionales bacterium]|nr:hypothetical protein [Bdellovibrionales bacterium]